MAFEQWGQSGGADRERAKRLATSYVAAAVVVGGLLAAGVAFGGQIKQRVLEEETQVTFVPPPEPAKPPPPPPPPPPAPKPKLAARAAPPPPLGVKVDAPPTELPTTRPTEADPNQAVAAQEAGDPNGVAGGTGKPGGGGMTAPAAPTAAPTNVRPYQIAEVTTAPRALVNPMPAYPEEARRAGVDATVIVKFVVTETGAVEDVKVIEGHPLLDRAVVELVRTWRFEPGTLDGKRVRVARKMKFPFHLRAAN